MKKVMHYQLDVKPKRTERIQNLLNYVRSQEPMICIERARYVTESYKETETLPAILRRAKADEKVFTNMSIYILPGSLLVGNQASRPRGVALFPEFAVDFLERELIYHDPYDPADRPADRYKVDDRLLPELKKIINWWKGRTHKERIYANLPDEAIRVHDKSWVVNDFNFMHGGDGHYSPDYPWLLEHGVGHIIRKCKDGLENLDWHEADAVDKMRFYEAVIISCQALIQWARRYANLAKEKAKTEKDPRRKEELLKIADICRWVPENPARNFHEALQFITFVQLAVQIEDNGQGISLGRLDQFLWPYYKKDLAEGKITPEEAEELFQNMFIILETVERFRSWPDTDYFRGNPIFQNVTLGGVDPYTREDSSNELTYIILDAVANARTTQPTFYVRWHKKAPEEYKLKAAEVIRVGTGFPAVANDELYIKAMLRQGYSEEDAYNYCVISCAETGVQGLRGGRTGAAWYCLAKTLELTLYNGKDPRTGEQFHPNINGKDLSSFSNFEELWEAFCDQISYYLKIHVMLDNIIDKLWEEHLEEPLAAALGCPRTTLERGKALKQGGAKYDFSGNQTIGLANVANSLYAIKKLVFEDKKITGGQLLHALRTNFEDMNTDPTGPEIQQMCLSLPKYGNDIDEVDMLARDSLEYVCKELLKYKNTRYGRGPIGGTFQASTTTVSSNTPFGKITGALPDGRPAGKPLADGQSPMRGTDTKGPTAAVNSVSKLRNDLLCEGSLYNLKFRPEDLKGKDGLKRFVAIIDHYFDHGGMQMQFNVVGRETLRDAQKHPEEYSDLLVRVAGYSARFVNLAKEVQEDIIERTEERV